jgi:serine/threonine-protein kinase
MNSEIQGPCTGRVIAQRYLLEEPLGRGGMGTIWRAQHLSLDSRVAIKFLDPALAEDGEMLERFLREARSAAAVRSANVVQVLDSGLDSGMPYIAMELLEGESLDARLKARGRLSPAELEKVFGEVARAVEHAHELGVVHRDLKPGNIFIAREREREISKVLDFGIAKVVDSVLGVHLAAGTRTGTVLGTPHYMSPEQVRGQRTLDHRTDLWSLAVIAFECLTGTLPFGSSAIGDLVVQICTAKPRKPSKVAEVPAGFDEWFARGVRKDPGERFASARQMADALSGVLIPPDTGRWSSAWRLSAASSSAPSASSSTASNAAPAPNEASSPTPGSIHPLTTPIEPTIVQSAPRSVFRPRARALFWGLPLALLSTIVVLALWPSGIEPSMTASAAATLAARRAPQALATEPPALAAEPPALAAEPPAAERARALPLYPPSAPAGSPPGEARAKPEASVAQRDAASSEARAPSAGTERPRAREPRARNRVTRSKARRRAAARRAATRAGGRKASGPAEPPVVTPAAPSAPSPDSRGDDLFSERL